MRTRLLSLVFFLCTPPLAGASGYHPPFDRAVSEAEIIVFGEVVASWGPEVVRLKKAGPNTAAGQVYRMKIQRVFKGALKPGQEVTFFDPHAGSTASYRVEVKKENLSFLVRLQLDEFARRRYDLGAEVEYRPIRNLSPGSVFGNQALDGWLYLLEQFVEASPRDRSAVYRKILRERTDRDVLHYAITHLPDALSGADKTQLQMLARRHAQDPYIASYAVQKLVKGGAIFDQQTLREFFTKGSVYMREDLLDMVNRQNITGVRDLLFEILQQKEADAEQKIIDVLARLSPGFLKEKLRQHDLPFWKLIPCLQTLGINGSALGKKDFPPGVLQASPTTLRQTGELLAGNEFWAILAMGEPRKHKDWEPLFVLLEPVLRGPDTPVRRLTVALMRTFGKRVERKRDGYRLVHATARQKIPVRLKISMAKKRFRLDEPVWIAFREIMDVAGGWMAFEGPWGWQVERPDQSTTMTGGFFHEFEQVDLPRNRFVQLREGMEKTTKKNMTSSFDRPGRYQFRVKRLYKHDGGSAGLDAWTGVVFSEPIEIEIYE